MTKDELERNPRRTAGQIVAAAVYCSPPTLEAEIASALNLEWWRGYHAGMEWITGGPDGELP